MNKKLGRKQTKVTFKQGLELNRKLVTNHLLDEDLDMIITCENKGCTSTGYDYTQITIYSKKK